MGNYLTQNNSHDEKTKPTYKIIIAGNSNVGKTAFGTQISLGNFNLKSKSTSIDVYTKTLQMPNSNTEVKFELWDLPGHNTYRTYTNCYYRGANCIIVMFSVADYSSFKDLESWIREIKTRADTDVLLFVVGTQIDLAHKRQISFETAQEYATLCGAHYFEISALENKGCIELLFNIAALLIKQKKQPRNNGRQQVTLD